MAAICETKSSSLLQALECLVCFEVMRPPIYLCKTGHSICNRCFNRVENCPKCNVSYGKLQPDNIKNERLLEFKCPNGCPVSSSTFNSLHKIRQAMSDIKCFTCKASYNVVAYKGRLIQMKSFHELIAAGQPRNFSLEVLTENVKYSCENEGCDGKFKLAQKAEHDSYCFFRPMTCPDKSCSWSGSLNDFFEHAGVFVYDETTALEDMMSTDETCHNLKSLYRNVIVCHYPSTPQQRYTQMIQTDMCQIYVFQLKCIRGDVLGFTVTHVNTANETTHVDCKVQLLSNTDPSYERAATFKVQNYFDPKSKDKIQELPAITWLRENCFIDDKGLMTFHVQFGGRGHRIRNLEEFSASTDGDSDYDPLSFNESFDKLDISIGQNQSIYMGKGYEEWDGGKPVQQNRETIDVPASLCGHVIGKCGFTIKRINRESGAYCELDHTSSKDPNIRRFTIQGELEKIHHAKRLINEIVDATKHLADGTRPDGTGRN